MFLKIHIPTYLVLQVTCSTGSGRAVFILDLSEWKTSSGVCYFSIIGQSATPRATTPDAQQHLSKVDVYLQRDSNGLSPTMSSRLQLFSDIFSPFDGSMISHRDRSSLYTTSSTFRGSSKSPSPSPAANRVTSTPLSAYDDHCYTYGEAAFLPMVQLLQAAKSLDGHVFYDLGSGLGCAVVAAALSGIHFLKCVGVEILPCLADYSAMIVQHLGQNNSNNYSQVPQQHQQPGTSVNNNIVSDNNSMVSVSISHQSAKLHVKGLREKIARAGISFLPLMEIRWG